MKYETWEKKDFFKKCKLTFPQNRISALQENKNVSNHMGVF